MTVYCPCCGYNTLTAAINYEVCPICFWEDVPTNDMIMCITSNHVTLLQAQRNFLATGACEAEYITLTRPPTATEQRPPDWQPLEQRLRQHQGMSALANFCQKMAGKRSVSVLCLAQNANNHSWIRDKRMLCTTA